MMSKTNFENILEPTLEPTEQIIRDDNSSYETNVPRANVETNEIDRKTAENIDIDKFDYDCELVNGNSDYIGINFGSSLIVDGRVDWSNEKILDNFKNENNNEKITEVDVEQQKQINQKKIEAFKHYIDDFKDLKHARVNPFGASSPVSPAQSIEWHSGGSFDVNISPSFLEQMCYLTGRCEDTTLVVPFYNDQKPEEFRSDTPQNPAEISEYVAICNELIDELGGNITLELGNETNVSHQTGEMFAGDAGLQFASRVDPTEYAKFYFEVAKQIKAEHPEIKLSLAGIACYDESYPEQVLSTINQLKDESDIEINLVDIISYHPYGDKPQDGAYTIKDGKFVDTSLSFGEQLESMQKLANNFGISLDIGEINFHKDDPEQQSKLSQSLEYTAQQMVIAKIWPSAEMPNKNK